MAAAGAIRAAPAGKVPLALRASHCAGQDSGCSRQDGHIRGAHPLGAVQGSVHCALCTALVKAKTPIMLKKSMHSVGHAYNVLAQSRTSKVGKIGKDHGRLPTCLLRRHVGAAESAWVQRQVHNGVAYTADQELDKSTMRQACGALLHVVNLFVQRYETDQLVLDGAWQWVLAASASRKAESA